MASRFVLPNADVGNGIQPEDGAKLSFFETGTSTPKNTFSDAAGAIPNTNPVISDANGVFPDIFITGTYKVILTDKNDVQTGFGEADPVEEFSSGNFSINLINDLSQAYEFATVAAYKAFTTAFPVGKTIKLLDRQAEFTVITGTGTANDFNIIDSDQVSQSIDLIIKNSTVDIGEFGSTGVAGEDNTGPMQAALTFGQTINSDRGFTYLVPFGVHEATHLSVDRTIVGRAVVFKGTVAPSVSGSCIIKITDTTQQSGIEWDSGFGAENIVFDHNDARSVGTTVSPLYLIDIRNTDAADDTADLDVEFQNCYVRNFHRAIRHTGRGFLWNGGAILLGGGAVSRGCFLYLDWPNPFIPGTGPDQTLVTGMRSTRIVGAPRVHACTGTLVINEGLNANNLYQIDFDGIYCDTVMGLMRGAIVNINVNGGTWLSSSAAFLTCEAGFDCKNINLNAPNLLGMPEENIGEATFGGTVTAADVLANAQGIILSVAPTAGIVKNFIHTGGIVSNVKSDAYQIQKAIDGFTLEGINMSNMAKDNKIGGGTLRHVVNFLSTASTNINIANIRVDNLVMANTGARLMGNDENCTEITLGDNKISGSIRDTSTRPDDKNFGGDQSQTFCGRYTGLGGDTSITKFTASRYAKAVIVVQRTGGASPFTWMAIDSDSETDVRLNFGQLDCRQAANVTGAEYSFVMFF